MKHKVVSLFSGAGGLDLGFASSGKFEILLANEILDPPAETYSLNFKVEKVSQRVSLPCILRSDVADLDFSTLQGSEIDVVIGGPPCQDFSIVRGPATERKGVEVKRGRLYAHFVRALIKLQPKVFVFENVPGLKSSNNGLAYRTILEDFKNLGIRWAEVKEVLEKQNGNGKSVGYEVVFSEVVNMSKLGVPQARERLIIVGVRRDILHAGGGARLWRLAQHLRTVLSGCGKAVSDCPLTPIEAFEGKPLPELQSVYEDVMREYADVFSEVATSTAKEWKRKVWDRLTFDAVRDYTYINEIKVPENWLENAFKEHAELLEELGYKGVKVAEIAPPDGSNARPKESRTVIERLKRIPPGANHEFVRGTKWEVEGRGMSLIYRRIFPLKPAYTVVAYGGGGTWGYHYERDRGMLTNRERARLQTFPDWFLFCGGWAQVRAQIGEAVPPLAAKRIASALDEFLKHV